MESDIYVIIPCFNEKGELRSIVSRLVDEGYHVVLVDDGSDVDIKAQLKDLSIYYIRHSFNLGQGAALQTGMEYAILNGAKIMVHFDGDGQHQIADIPDLVSPILNGDCEMTLGSRFKSLESRNQVPYIKRFLLKLAIIVNGIMTGLWLSDAHNGFRALSRSAGERIQLLENRFTHASEILQEIRRKKIPFKEVSVNIVYSDYSKSKGQPISNSINILMDLLINKIR